MHVTKACIGTAKCSGCGGAPWKIGMECNIVSILGRLFASQPKKNSIIGLVMGKEDRRGRYARDKGVHWDC